MTEHASQDITIEVDTPHVLEAVLELDDYPKWIPEVSKVIVHKRDSRGRALVAEVTSNAMGKTVVHEYEYHYDNYPEQITWILIKGDMTKSLTGSYRFESNGERSTKVFYDLVVDLSVSLPGFLKKKAANTIVSSALENLKARCEHPQNYFQPS